LAQHASYTCSMGVDYARLKNAFQHGEISADELDAS
jgi:hypothetical protein